MEDAAVFSVVLFGSLGLAFVIPHLHHRTQRQLFSTSVGFAMYLMMWKHHVWFPLGLMTILYAQTRMMCRSNKCGAVSVGLAFCLCNLLRAGAAWRGKQLSLGADLSMYMLTLRASSLGFYAQDTGRRPRLVEWVEYLFFFPGLTSGPIMSIDDVARCLHHPDTGKARSHLFMLRRLKETAVHALAFLLFGSFVDKARLMISSGEELLTWPLWMRAVYIHLFCFMRRAQIGFVWMIAEVTCAAACLGYSGPKSSKDKDDAEEKEKEASRCITPQGGEPSKPTSSPDTSPPPSPIPGSSSSAGEMPHDTSGALLDPKVITAWEPSIELALSTKMKVRLWNCTVQRWLALNIYKRLPRRWSRMTRRVIAMAVSAFWHGTDPGLYLSFVLYPFFEYAECFYTDLVWPGDKHRYLRHVNNVVRGIVASSTIDFALTPFQLLGLHPSVRAWRALNFYGFYMAIIYLLVGNIGLVVGVFKKPRKGAPDPLRDRAGVRETAGASELCVLQPRPDLVTGAEPEREPLRHDSTPINAKVARKDKEL